MQNTLAGSKTHTHTNETNVWQDRAPIVSREVRDEAHEYTRAPSPVLPDDLRQIVEGRSSDSEIPEFVEMEPYPEEEPHEVVHMERSRHDKHPRSLFEGIPEAVSPVRPTSSHTEVPGVTSRDSDPTKHLSLQESEVVRLRALVAQYEAQKLESSAQKSESSAQGAAPQPQLDNVELIRLFTEAIRGTQGPKPKVAKMREPMKFTGDNPKEDVNSWLRSIDNYLRETPEDRWLDVARTFLAGRAEQMFAYRETLALSDGLTVDATWFREFMRTNFAPMLAKERAFRKLLELRVKADSSDYETVAQSYFEYRSKIPGGESGFNFVMNQLFLRTLTDRLRDKVLVDQKTHVAHEDIHTMHKICLLHAVKPAADVSKPKARETSPERKRFKAEVRVERKPSERKEDAGKKSSKGGSAKAGCYNCGRKGHYARDCKAPRKDDKQGKDRPSR